MKGEIDFIYLEIEKEMKELDGNPFILGKIDLSDKIENLVKRIKKEDKEFRTKFKLNQKELEFNFNEDKENEIKNEPITRQEYEYKKIKLEKKYTFHRQKTKRNNETNNNKDIKNKIIFDEEDEDESENEIGNEEMEEKEENNEEDEKENTENNIQNENDEIFGEDKYPPDDGQIGEPPITNAEVSDIELDEEEEELELEEIDSNNNNKNNNQILTLNEFSSENNLQFTEHILGQVKSPIDMITISEKVYELCNKKDKSKEKIDLSPLNTFKKKNDIKVQLFKLINMNPQYNQFLQSGTTKLNDYISIDQEDEVPTVMALDNRDYKTNCSIWFGTNKSKLIRIPICSKPSKDCQGMVIDTEEVGISAIDSFENYLIMGHFDGTIQIWEDQKVIDKIKDIKNEILKIKFIKINIKKKKYEFIYSDSNGMVNYVKRAKILLMSRNQNEQIVSNKEFPVYKISIFSKEKDLKNIKKKNILIALTSLQNVSLYKIRPKTENPRIAIIEIPYCSIGDFVFDCDFGYGFGPISELNVKNEIVEKKNLSLIENTFIEEGKQNIILFVVSFGIVIRLFEIEMNSNYTVNIREIGHYINDFPVYKIGFIKKSYLTLIDSKKSIKIINTFCFENEEYKEVHSETSISILNYHKVDLSNYYILKQNNIFFNNSSDGKRCFALSNFLGSTIIFDQNIFIITKNKFLLYKLYKWDEVINDFCQNEKYKEMIWLSALFFGKNKNLFYNDSEENNKEEYERSLQESLYIFLIKGTKEENNYKELRLFIQYCLITGRFNDFYEAKKILEKRKLDKYLYNYTTEYIFNGNFSKFIFDINFLKDFINYYINKNEYILLSKILLKLNVDNLNRPEIFNILKKKEIINPFIYAKIREKDNLKNDFFKPIECLFELFESKLLNEKKEIGENKNNIEKIKKEYYKLITEHDMKYYYDKTLSCNDYIGHKLFWYINKCLSKEEFPKGNFLPKEDFEITCKKILLFLTTDKVMKSLLQFDSFSYFNILTKLFIEPKLYRILEKNSDEKIYPYKGLESFVESYLGKISIEYLCEKYFYYQVQMFVKDKIKKFKNNYYIKYDFFQMTALICSKENNNDLFIDRQTLIDGIKFFINYEYSLQKEESKNYYDPFDCHKIPDKKNLLYKEFSENIEKNILYLLQCLQRNHDFFEDDLNKLISLEGLAQQNKVRTYLYEFGRKFEELYMIKYEEYENKNPMINKEKKLKNFFGWINDTFRLTKKLDLMNSKKKICYYKNFKNFIQTKFIELSKISIEKLSRLIEQWFNDEQESIIFSFGDSNISDALKYIYITKYMYYQEQQEEKNNQYEEYLLMKIQLLIKNNHKEQIIKLLKKNRVLWNKKVLENLLKNEIYDGVMYIYQKIEDVDNCTKMSISKIDEIFSTIKNLYLLNTERDNSYIISIKLEEIKIYLDIGLGVCPFLTEKNNYNMNDVKCSWLKFLDKFYEFKDELDSLNEYKSKNLYSNFEKVEQNLLENIEYIISKMNDYIPLSIIVEVLSEKFKNKKFKEYSKMFIRIFFSARRIEDIYKSIHNILFNSLSKDINFFLNESNKGIFENLNECDKCKKSICDNYEISNLQYFKCGHIYHNSCCAIEGGKYTCFICRTKDEKESAYTNKTNFVFRKKENVQKNDKKGENQIKNDEEKKKEAKKNKLLGKLKKITQKKNEKLENFKTNIENIQIKI